MTSRIETVVFDVGNVLLAWDPRHAFRSVFDDPARMEWFLTEVCSPDWNRQQDGGRPWAEAEAEAIARHPGLAAEIRLYRARWHDMVPGLLEDGVAIHADLTRAGVPLYAITNFATDTFAEAQARFPVLTAFEGIIVSASERLLKPDVAIYRLLCDRYGLDPARCVFIDDSAANCEGARRIGMAAIHHNNGAVTRRGLADLGLPV
jgi:2-haloacid dehalogenase